MNESRLSCDLEVQLNPSTFSIVPLKSNNKVNEIVNINLETNLFRNSEVIVNGSI